MVGYFQNPVMEIFSHVSALKRQSRKLNLFFQILNCQTSEVTRTFVLKMKSVKYVRNTPES